MNIQKGSFSSIEQLQDRYLTPAKKVEKKESMEVCFIPGDYRDFLREQLPALDRGT